MKRGFSQLTFCMLVTGALYGCTSLGPDYTEPTPAWLAQWQPDLYGQLENPPTQLSAMQDWWLRFDDTALDSLIASVIDNNPNLQISALRLLESYARLGGARALRLPQSQQFTASATWLRQRQSNGLLPASDNTLGSYNLGLGAGWEIDFWGRFQRGIEAADAAFLSDLANQRDVQVLLISQTASIYYAWRTTQQRIRIAEQNAQIQKRSFEITQRLFDSGQESELDLQQAKTQYLATLAGIPDLERSLVQQRNAIAALLGRPPGVLAQLRGGEAELPTLEPVAISGLPVQLLLRRPDVRRSAWQAAGQSAQIGIAKAEFYPSISLLGSFGWTGDSLDVTRDGTAFAVGPAIRWNIFDYGRIRANVRVQDARLQQALLAFDAVVLDAAREIDDAAIAVIKTGQARAVFAQAREAAQRALELANARYQEGYADFQRVLDAQRALFSQSEKELLNDGAHIVAVIELFRALGGGWKAQSFEEMIPEGVRSDLRARENWGDLLDVTLPEDLGSADSKGSAR
ncbi:MAG: efflux transporter outer membrane subunit [Congregibacter sp.]